MSSKYLKKKILRAAGQVMGRKYDESKDNIGKNRAYWADEKREAVKRRCSRSFNSCLVAGALL